MLRILWNGRSSMMAQQDKLDCISNNLANTSTPGYKREDVSFKDLMYEKLDRRGYPTNAGENKNNITGTGVRTGRWIRDNSQGDLINTSQKTDFAIDGKGYFKVFSQDDAGNIQTRYSRAGSFNIDSNGELVDGDGNKIEVQFFGDKEKFSKDNFHVNEEGTIQIKYENGYRDVGKINVYDAIGDDAFISTGNNLYMPKEGVTTVAVKSGILQGFIEGSNSKVEKEMTDMIVSQRAFSFGAKALETADQMWGMVNNIKGR